MDNFNSNHINKIKFISFSLIILIILGFIGYVIYERENVLTGILKIITSPAVLITDFLVIGGIGAVFLNAFLIFIFKYLSIISTLSKALYRIRNSAVVPW